MDPSSVLVWIVVGLVAGLVASRVMLGHGLGIVLDVVVGIAGAVIGGFLAAYFGVTITVPGHPIVTEIIIAFLGAIILLLLVRLLGIGRRRMAFSGRRRSRPL
ncbi:MAG: GlsB/YeaQ/YmgE family stress response membrane protein [Candidatus Dormibacteraeota bacterium]|nr:GlsB/YeaQ/YmgE family stress response membrane protein [Candidatus Dormibacteraeota bacterium]MBV9525486.1 GlsB/YeaQ/YmgE family stress response membrane protein [Candidatus Dormibacteraeota bacterium]